MHVTHKKSEKKPRTTKSDTAYNRAGFGILKREDKNWYYKDPITELTHGPYFSRDDARNFVRKLKADRKKEAEAQAAPWQKRA